ncbi:MAG: MFS transporter [Spirochaetales bacterium]|nr:MFS transporter [Leptospiraceae bacterium]MCP5482335.1 MFS transporter [Spirochaetales bacterium]MCP5484226.1 MFS transporter [Spirochaetales bacterium]
MNSDPSVSKRQAQSGFPVLLATITGSAMSFIDYSALNVVLPLIKSDLKSGISGAQWIATAYILTLSALILIGGALGDSYGRRRMFAFGVLIFSLSSVACGLAPHTGALVAARAFQGIGGALLVPGSLSIINAFFPTERQPAAIGIWSASSALMTAIGPVLGGYLGETFSWRYIFFLNVPLAVLVLVTLYSGVPESRDESRAPGIDWWGAVLAAMGMGSLVYGLIELPGNSLREPRIAATLSAGILLLLLFLWHEKRTEQPMMPPGLFGNAAFAGANLLTLFLYMGLSGFLFFLPFELIGILNYRPLLAGMALLPFVALMVLLSLGSGILVRRFGRRKLLIAGPSIAGLGFFAFAFAVPHENYVRDLLPAILIMSAGMAITVAPLTSTVMAAVGQNRSGIASGVNNAVARAAGLFAIAVFGVVLISIFNAELEQSLRHPRIPTELAQAMINERARLSELHAPEGTPAEETRLVRMAVVRAFEKGFRWIACLAGALAIAGGATAALTIDRHHRTDPPL